MKDRRKTMTSERAAEIARMGKAASPWGQGPACNTRKAHASFAKHRRLHLIEAMALKQKRKTNE